MTYGVNCETCHEAVEYADISTHPCSELIRARAEERGRQILHPSWNFRLVDARRQSTTLTGGVR